MVNALARALNDAVIRRVAGAQSYQRGLDHFSHGHVESLEDDGEGVRAVGRGNQDYRVTLTAEDARREARLWLRLAAKREKEHPEDAAPIYLKYAEAGVSATSNGRYEDAVNLLAKAAAVMKRLDRSAEFVRHREALRAKYKIKRNSSSWWSRNGRCFTSRRHPVNSSLAAAGLVNRRTRFW